MAQDLKINHKQIYFADFETLTHDNKYFKKLGHTDVYMWGVLNYQDDDFFIYGKDLKTFFNFVFTPVSKIIYFHNLTFDGNFIYKYILKNFKNLKYKDELLNTDLTYNYWTLFRLNRKIYSIEIKKRVKTPTGSKKIITIRFQCTYNLINSSISALSKNFSVRAKHDINAEQNIKNKYQFSNLYDFGDWEVWEKEDLKKVYLDYLYNDVYVAKASFKYYKNVIESQKWSVAQKWNKKNVTLEHILTTASVSQKMVKNYLYTTKINPFYLRLKNYDDHLLSKKFLSGGLVQFDKTFNQEQHENGLSIDKNSSYPWSMTKLLPYGKIYHDKSFLKRYQGPYLTYVKVYMVYEIKRTMSKLIFIKNVNKHSSNRYNKVGEGEYYFLLDEFETLKKIYNITIIKIEYFYSKADTYLKAFIEELYKLKENANDDAFRGVFKLLLNSLYGSFIKKALYPAMLLLDKNVVDEMEKNNIRSFDRWSDIVYKQEEFKELNKRFITAINNDKLQKLKHYPNFLIGATITAWSRIDLIETIIKIGPKRFIYCDTDSIFFKWEGTIETLKTLINLDDKKLGAWKIEYQFNKGKVLGAKRYVFTNDDHYVKKAMAGVKNKDDDYETIINYLEDGFIISNAKYQIHEDDYGIYLKYKDIIIKKGQN